MRFVETNRVGLIVRWSRMIGPLLLLACAGDEAPAKAPALAPREVWQLGLTVDLPPGAVVGNATLSSGALFTGAGVGATTIQPADGDWPRTAAAEIAQIAWLDPRSVLVQELADGWIVRFENGPPSRPNYWFEGRRNLAGRVYSCATTVTDASQRDRGAEVCASLRVGSADAEARETTAG